MAAGTREQVVRHSPPTYRFDVASWRRSTVRAFVELVASVLITPVRNAPRMAAALVFSLAIAITLGMRAEVACGQTDHAALHVGAGCAAVDVDEVVAHDVADGAGQPGFRDLLRREPSHAHHVAVLAEVAHPDQRNVRPARAVEHQLDGVVSVKLVAQAGVGDQGRGVQRFAFAAEAHGKPAANVVRVHVLACPDGAADRAHERHRAPGRRHAVRHGGDVAAHTDRNGSAFCQRAR